MRLTFNIFVVLIFCSCKKDPPVTEPEPLKGDREVLLGSWVWEFSEHHHGSCNNQSFMDTIVTSDTYLLDFMQNGNVKFVKNDDLVSVENLFFQEFISDTDGYCNISNAFKFDINLNDSYKTRLWGCVNSDTIECSNLVFPFETEEGCEVYWSYFIKQ